MSITSEQIQAWPNVAIRAEWARILDRPTYQLNNAYRARRLKGTKNGWLILHTREQIITWIQAYNY